MRFRNLFAVSPWGLLTSLVLVSAATVSRPAPAEEKAPSAPAVAATTTAKPATATTAVPPQAKPAAVQTKPAARPAVPAADPYGFTYWLNATRAQYGLAPVGYDPNLTNWAAVNNNQQAARGMGHYVMGPARRQNCAMGNAAQIGAVWMASPAHRAALLDPNIRWIGLAGYGAYWTFNAF